MSTHTLEFADNYRDLLVKESAQTVATYELDGDDWVKILCENGNYQITVATCGGSCYDEVINLGNLVSPFILFESATMDIGVSDVRDMEGHEEPVPVNVYYTYYLEACPVHLWRQSATQFHIKSPCTSPCEAPNTACRDKTVEEQ